MKVEDVEDIFRYKCDNCDELFTDLQDKNNHCAMKNCSYPNRIPNNFVRHIFNLYYTGREIWNVNNFLYQKLQDNPVQEALLRKHIPWVRLSF